MATKSIQHLSSHLPLLSLSGYRESIPAYQNTYWNLIKTNLFSSLHLTNCQLGHSKKSYIPNTAGIKQTQLVSITPFTTFTEGSTAKTNKDNPTTWQVWNNNVKRNGFKKPINGPNNRFVEYIGSVDYNLPQIKMVSQTQEYLASANLWTHKSSKI